MSWILSPKTWHFSRRRLLSCGEIEIHTKAEPKDCQAPATLSLNWVVLSRPLTFPGCSKIIFYISKIPAQSSVVQWDKHIYFYTILAINIHWHAEWSQTNQPIQNNAQSADGGFAQSALRISGHPHSGSSWLQPLEVTQPNHYSRWLQPNLQNSSFLWFHSEKIAANIDEHPNTSLLGQCFALAPPPTPIVMAPNPSRHHKSMSFHSGYNIHDMTKQATQW